MTCVDYILITVVAIQAPIGLYIARKTFKEISMSKIKQCYYCQIEMQVKDLKVVKVNKQRVYVCTDCLVKCNSPANRADSKD